ncbi:MAG: ABC transporter ATP-binding protein [Dehalococcoidia bacterium]|nr:ABC transporter ATP-binding protein [Dehalococcoidia bacterium]
MESGRNIIMGIENLYTSFYTKEGEVKAVNGINLSLYEKSILGVVGESGSGKSATALSIMRLLPEPGVIKSGSVHFEKLNVLELNYEELRQVRGKDMAMIFQEPLSALNPLVNIETHMQEVLQAHSSMSKRDAKDISLQLLAEFDIPSPSETLKLYPFQLSGGQIQRVMIAMSMAWQPRMLIADEITSNLDVTLQADVLDRLRRLISEKQSSIVLITHDMGVIAQLAEFVAVMYAGSIVEYSSTIDLFNKPYHPYTDALLQTIPRLDQPDRNLQQIPGSPPDLIDLPDQCPYLSRCSKATNQCRLEPRPLLREIRPGHFVACYNELQ